MLSFPVTIITTFLAIIFLITGYMLLVDIFNKTPSIPVLIVSILDILASVLFFIIAIRYGTFGF